MTPQEQMIADRLECVLASNRHPFRCEVQSMPPRGWVVLAHGLVPEQFQEIIREYLGLAVGVEFQQVNMVWRNGSTTIELVIEASYENKMPVVR